ncbi:TraE/TraK family type IV conjugative transfer system protein [Acinetobacter gyllenbergii]|uniref:TraE/TraK family type IV conjugative transfer system protein n=1 Tax=Acinetobacter gyllenbergii TaxID=134534 RepID=UPI003AF8B92E
MDAESGNKTINSMQARNRSQTIVIFSLVGVIFGLIFVLAIALTNNKTILQFPGKDSQSFIVGNSTANQEYFVNAADYFVNKLYNVTPVNARKNFDSILVATDPRTYPQIKKMLNETETRIVKEGITSVWSSTGAFKYLESEKTVTVEGMLKTYLADRLVSQEPKKLNIKFSMNNGTLTLYSMGEVRENNGTQ